MTEKEFNSTYLSLAEACYRVAFYILESEADAEDALQELFLKLWKNRDSLDGIQNPKAYVMTLLRNLCWLGALLANMHLAHLLGRWCWNLREIIGYIVFARYGIAR